MFIGSAVEGSFEECVQAPQICVLGVLLFNIYMNGLFIFTVA